MTQDIIYFLLLKETNLMTITETFGLRQDHQEEKNTCNGIVRGFNQHLDQPHW